MTMKRFLTILLVLALVFALAACAETGKDTAPPDTGTPPEESTPVTDTPTSEPPAGAWNPANIREHTFILAHGMAESSPDRAYHAFCEKVKELSDGKIVIEEQINGTLLKDTETFEGLRSGTADFIHSMGSYVNATITELSPLTIAGYYGGDDWLDFAFGTKDLVESIYGEYNIKFLGGLYQGTSVFASSKVQIKQPGDVVGLAWRASGDWVIKTVEAWGGAATNIALPNLADAFQKGTVDGVTTGWTIVGGWGIYEVAKYLTTSNITEGFAALLMNGDSWNKLNADEQALIAYAGDFFVNNNYELTKVECQNYYDKIKAEGKNEIYELTAAENKAFLDIANSLYPEMAKSLGDKGKQLIDQLDFYNGRK
jgi:C4-dicarboxylate-binding protein DctP